MRVDKYLWSVRIFKTRSKAAEAVKKNQVSIDGNHIKASRVLKIGEVVRVRKNSINFEFEVLDFPKSRVGAKLVADFCLNVTPEEEVARMEILRSARNHYRQKGTGRPTKRDRRDLDDYMDDDMDWDFFDNED